MCKGSEANPSSFKLDLMWSGAPFFIQQGVHAKPAPFECPTQMQAQQEADVIYESSYQAVASFITLPSLCHISQNSKELQVPSVITQTVPGERHLPALALAVIEVQLSPHSPAHAFPHFPSFQTVDFCKGFYSFSTFPPPSCCFCSPAPHTALPC